MNIIIRPLSPFGAEVIGLDLDAEAALDAATCQALRDAWVEHGILLFRNALHSEAGAPAAEPGVRRPATLRRVAPQRCEEPVPDDAGAAPE